jgi:hypothetical protein
MSRASISYYEDLPARPALDEGFEDGKAERLERHKHLRLLMDEPEFKHLRRNVVWLRDGIDRAKAVHDDPGEIPAISQWPSNCCDAPACS